MGTFDLLWGRLFENPIFQPQSQQGQSPRFPAAAGTARRTLKADPSPNASGDQIRRTEPLLRHDQ